jgi:hypothetical protein
MSNVVSALVQRRKVGSLTRKAILLYMADRASDDGTGIWTSKSHMADDLEMTRKAVQNNVKDMVGLGLLHVAGEKPCRNGYTVEYRIDLAAVQALEPTRASDVLGANHVRGSIPTCEPRSHDMRTTFAGRGEPRSHKPSIEPSLNREVLGASQNAAPELPLGDAPDPKPKRAKERQAIPPNWIPSDRNVADAQAIGLTMKDIDHETPRFRDYHLGKGSLQADWDATWRRWCRNAVEFARRRVAGQSSAKGRGSGADLASIAARRAAERAEQDAFPNGQRGE